MRQQKETRSGEKNFWRDTTSILERNSHKLILGNAANHELTLKFIESGYNLSLVYPQHPKGHFRATDSRESAGIVGLSVNEAKGIKSW